MIIAEIISIGDELLKGSKVNTNAAFIATGLGGIGVPVRRVVTCADNEDAIAEVLSESLSRADVVLVTGGLGPTRDDRTKKAAAKLLHRGVEECLEAYEMLKAWFASRGRSLPDNLRDQASVVEGSLFVPNPVGTAAGMIIPCGERFNDHYLVLMPGVPLEMQAMMRETILPFFAAVSSSFMLHTPVKTVGIGESQLAELLVSIEDNLPDSTTLAYLPHIAGVDLMISTTGSTEEGVDHDNRKVVDAIIARAGRYIYATGETSLEETIGGLLVRKGLSIATAESCTGGLVASRLTDISGSSAYFLQGMVTYSNESKTALLGVPPAILDQHGAVSEQVAEAMALGALSGSGADVAVSTTGVAGPSGGSAEKPVGTLCIGVARKMPDGSVLSRANTFSMYGTRLQCKQRFAEAALREVWKSLTGIEG